MVYKEGKTFCFYKRNDFNKLFLLFLFLKYYYYNYSTYKLQTPLAQNIFHSYLFIMLQCFWMLKAEHYIISRRRPLDLVPSCIGSVSVKTLSSAYTKLAYCK